MLSRAYHFAAVLLFLASAITGCNAFNGDHAQLLKGRFTVYKQTFYKEGSVKEYRTFTTDPTGQQVSDTMVRSGGKSTSEVKKYETLSDGTIKISIFDSNNRLKHYITQEYQKTSERITRRSVFTPDGLLKSRTDYRYDAAGALTGKANFDGAGKLNGYSYEFDSQGNVVKDQFYESGVLKRSTAHTYNGTNQAVLRNHFDAAGTLTASRIFMYDAAGNLTRQDDLDAGGTLTWRAESHYDAAGNRIKIVLYDAPGGAPRLRFTRIFEYDKKRNLVKVSNHDATGQLLSYGNYEYGQDGRKRKQSHFDAKGGLLGFSTFTYRME